MTYGGGTGRSGRVDAVGFATALLLAVPLLLPLLVPLDSLAQATRPSTDSRFDSRIRRLFIQLSDPNTSVREQARVALLGLSVEQLGELRRVVEASRPISPEQAAVLHDIVIHVYIAAQRVDVHPPPSPYEREIEVSLGPEPRSVPGISPTGFLGVLLEPMYDRRRVAGDDDVVVEGPNPQNPMERASLGVLIKETWPGFAGFRHLRVGDIVVGTGRAPFVLRGDNPPATQPVRPEVRDVKEAVSSTVPDRTIVLQVIRLGHIVDVPVRVTPRPPWAPNGPNDEAMMRAIQRLLFLRAENYWDASFRLLVPGDELHLS